MKFPRHINIMLNTLIFSGLGCLAYLFLVSYGDIPEAHQLGLSSWSAYLAVVVAFNLVGHGLLYINRRFGREGFDVRRVSPASVLYLLALAGILLVLNYLVSVSLKVSAGMPHPFVLRITGIKMIVILWLIEAVMLGQIGLNSVYRHLIALNNHTANLEEQAARARYQALQDQLNPHFLFNSLNVLVSEIEYDPANAALFTRHLSDIYRYILQNNEKQTVSLREELEFLNSYLFLHRVRLGDCLHIDNRLEPALNEMRLPPLTLQLAAENVFKHNVVSPSRPMNITLSYDEQSQMLVISNPVAAKKGNAPSGHGLSNLSARYLLLCGRNIATAEQDGHFTIKVPLLYE